MLKRVCAVAIVTAVWLGTRGAAAPTAAQDRAELERMAARATERIRALHREADALAARERTLLGDLRRIELQRQLKAEELGRVDIEAQKTFQDLEDTGTRVRELEQAIARQRPDIVARLTALYKVGSPGYARLFLNVDDLRAVGRAYRLVSAIADEDRRKIAEHQASLAGLRRTETALIERRTALRSFQEEGRRAREELDRAIRAQAQLIQNIDSERDLNAQLIGELQTAQQHLQASLADLATTGSAATLPGALPLRMFRGELDWPVAGKVATGFGVHPQTRFGTTIVRNGIDISAAEGTTATAAHPGTVAFADTFTGFGNLVILDHGGQSYTLYGYLRSMTVSRGARVSRGESVGLVGRSPAGVPALYFEVRIDGKPVDPLQWLKQH